MRHLVRSALPLLTVAFALILNGCKADEVGANKSSSSNDFPTDKPWVEIEPTITFQGTQYNLDILLDVDVGFFSYATVAETKIPCSIYSAGGMAIAYYIALYRGPQSGGGRLARIHANYDLTELPFPKLMTRKGINLEEGTCPIDGTILEMAPEEVQTLSGRKLAISADTRFVLRTINTRFRGFSLRLSRPYDIYPDGSSVFFGGAIDNRTLVAQVGAYRESSEPNGPLFSDDGRDETAIRINEGLRDNTIQHVSTVYSDIPRDFVQLISRKDGYSQVIQVAGVRIPVVGGQNTSFALAGTSDWEQVFGPDAEAYQSRLNVHRPFHEALSVREGASTDSGLSLTGGHCLWGLTAWICSATKWLQKRQRVGVIEENEMRSYY